MDQSSEHQTHEPVVVTTGTTIDRDRVDREEVVTDADQQPLLSWGAILAGLFVLIATSWLLYLLGIALGVSIADATDGDAVGAGLGVGAVIWMLVSSLIAYFLGSLLAARLSGKTDSTVGMLHGLTLWGVATTLLVVFSYMGVTNLLQTGAGLVQSTVSTVASATSATVAQTVDAGQFIASAANTELADSIQARLKRRATSVVSKAAAEGADGVKAQEVRKAIEAMDTQTLQQISMHVTKGELRSARETLADETNLSTEEVREIIDNITGEFEELIGTDDNATGVVADVTNALKRQTADLVASLDAKGGADVSSDDVKTALSQLTPATMQKVAMRLAQGKTQSAKDVLTANTDLTSRQVDDIVGGVQEDVSRTVDRYKKEAGQAVEAASTYTQAVLWSVFLASAMGLAVSLLGGCVGTESTRTIEVERRRKYVAPTSTIQQS